MNFLYNPYEISFCGFSGSGKTTLITTLIKQLKGQFSIAYIKSDAHDFFLDYQGKDTYKATEGGAKISAIHSHKSRAIMEQKKIDFFWGKSTFIDEDLVFIEGYKEQKNLKKIVFLDTEKTILKKINIDEVSAFVISNTMDYFNHPDIPCFNRDDIDALTEHIQQEFSKVRDIKFKGLVLGGGKSLRMGRDKYSMTYHGHKNISLRINDFLKFFCEEVFFSCRAEQQLTEEMKEMNFLYDRLDNFGPLGAIITALEYDPKVSWIVVACDLPYVSENTFQYLVDNYNPYNYATCFKSHYDNLPEPLCTIYSPKALSRCYQLLSLKKKCPRKMLIHSPITMLNQQDSRWLDNVNTPEQAIMIKKNIDS